MFSDQSGLTPNGCTVDNDGVVWIINMKDGVSKAQVVNGENIIGETESWSAGIKAKQNEKQMAGTCSCTHVYEHAHERPHVCMHAYMPAHAHRRGWNRDVWR